MNSKIFLAGAAMIMGLGFTSCSDVLDETPRTTFTPEYFKTVEGVKGGITSLYANLRNTWGAGYYFSALETGTDEYTWGESADDNFKVMDLTVDGPVLMPNTGHGADLWNSAFSNINTASGVIENGTAAKIDKSLIAEANFFRGFDYFQLVQTYGGVPLDLGAGNLKFNTSPIRVSTRNTVPEVYQAIFSDLKKAVEDLNTESRVTGGVTKNVARLFLSKAYLTYGWWLKNPNNIPTYPECSRTDLDGHDAAWYFQQAYNVALEAIKNKGQYDLEKTFGDVFYGPNDRNKEIMLYADHTAQDEYFNGGVPYGWAGEFAPNNSAHWMNRCNYATFGIPGFVRAGYQSFSRPWTRMATPVEVPAKFNDQSIDYRFEGTFVTAWRINECLNGETPKTKEFAGANGAKLAYGDVILVFEGEEDPNVKYKDAPEKAIESWGTRTGEPYYIMTPSHLKRVAYLNVWKNGYYNEKTHGDGTVGNVNGANPRPANIARFAELYYIAAEAAVMGAQIEGNYTARELINVVRERAGRWSLAKWADKDNDIKVGEVYEDHGAEMKAATPAKIDIDYILDERFREFFGEGLRWFDLVRTQTWATKAATYHIGGRGYTDPVNVEYKRNIKPTNYLRPIPSSQIDALQMTPEEKAAYQNPGYNKK